MLPELEPRLLLAEAWKEPTMIVAHLDGDVGAVLIIGVDKNFCMSEDVGELGAAAEPDTFVSALAANCTWSSRR